MSIFTLNWRDEVFVNSAAAKLPVPMDGALSELAEEVRRMGKEGADPRSMSWYALSELSGELFFGGYQPERGDHRQLALGLAAIFGGRLVDELGAIWFRHADAGGGMAIGFRDLMLPVQPFGAVSEALQGNGVPDLEAVFAELSSRISAIRARRVSAGSGSVGQGPLTAETYEQLLNPRWVQFALLDCEDLRSLLHRSPGAVIAALVHRYPAVEAERFLRPTLKALSMLPQGSTLENAMESHPRLVERVACLLGFAEAGQSATEDFFADVIFPLLRKDSTALFVRQIRRSEGGVLLSFLNEAPNRREAAKGLFNFFQAKDASAPALLKGVSKESAGEVATPLHLIQIDVSLLKEDLAAFGEAAIFDAIKRFGVSRGQGAGLTPQEATLLERATAMIRQLQSLTAAHQAGRTIVVMRRATETETLIDDALFRTTRLNS